jgi:DNA-binding NarL/FixJ family response regulator
MDDPESKITVLIADDHPMLREGLTNQAIGQALGLSPGTAKGYVQTLAQKLYAADRTQAAVKAIRLGLVK